MPELLHAKDFEWVRENYPKLQRKYADNYIAVKDGKVIAHGKNFGEVYDKAKSILNSEDFAIDYIISGGILETNI